MTVPRILIACIGNIFLGDDAFGVEVARRLLPMAWPPGVHVEDFGIRGVDLAYSLLDNYDVVIFVDTVQRGEPPGTLYVIEPELANLNPAGAAIDAHTMDPATVLRSAVSMGADPGRVLLVGCEPGPLPPDDQMQMDLSPPVAAAVNEAVSLVRDLAAKILAGNLPSAEANKELSSCSEKSLE
jgi:hydrogenase maturation protease